ncbi:MAG: PD-(D/E)XK nuclease family protein [Salinivirgaceae bacterium]
MQSFLNEVAQWLFNNHRAGFKHIQLVFPNQRSGVFFMHHLKNINIGNHSKAPFWLPRIHTINEFISEFSKLRLAEPIELLGILYRIYVDKSKSLESFDDFFSWGETMLRDFNDVDKYLVDPKTIFSNVRALKDMEADFQFLTEEQLEVIQRFFATFNKEHKSELKEQFLKIWEVLFPVYQIFREKLVELGLAYEGMLYNDALSRIKEKQTDDFPFEKIYFIGFNAITPVEERIFEYFQTQGRAGFFWDFDSYYIENKQMEAGFFQRKYLRQFPMEVGFNLPDTLIENKKQIQVVSVPTDHGQVFKASQLISTITAGEIGETALVLSNEQLLMPVLNQIPQNVDQVNVTMGYGVSESLMAQVIDLLINLQTNAKIAAQQTTTFYYKNVVDLLQHPFFQVYDEVLTASVIESIRKENLYQIDVEALQQNELFASVFKSVSDISDFEFYLKENVTLFGNLISSKKTDNGSFAMEQEFGYHVFLKINQLSEQLQSQQIEIQMTTYFRLLRRVIKTLRVPFEGEPIGGLQVMGFLETRNLDFKNLIILSVNEGTLPAGMQNISFIPYGLRRGFGLPTRELHDAMYAYYFYRLIQRAEKVWLIYNSAVGGLSSGEKSRYIYQLQFDSNFQIGIENVLQTIDVVSPTPIEIKKQGDVLNKLMEYLDADNPKVLSPSALSIYLMCPLRYYFRSLAQIHEPDEVEETVDARLFGNIFHKVAEKFYEPFLQSKTLLTAENLKKLGADSIQLDAWIMESFNEVLRGEKTKNKFTLQGKNHIVFDVIKKYLNKMISIDQDFAPFSIVGLELKMDTPVSFTFRGKKAAVKVGGLIDRLDRDDKQLRIVDYKTGADKLVFSSFSDVFDPEKIANTKAVFQTFVYSYVIKKNFPDEPVIVPTVYQLKKFFEDEKSFAVSSKDVLYASGNFNDVADEVESKLEILLTELFNEQVPFTQTDDLKKCEYCPYRNICGR